MTLSTPAFSDDFSTTPLSLWNGTTGTWQPSYNWSPDGYIGSDMESWLVNPFYGPTSAADDNPYQVVNGALNINIMPLPADVPSSASGGAAYLSGILTTHQSFSQEYGYFAVNAELSSAPGTMSAFWMLPSNGSWPPEIDVFEVLANDPTMLTSTAHSVTTSQDQGLTTEQGMTTSFNTYAVNWTASTITWYFNGQQVYQIPTPSNMNQPMYMLLGTMAGTPSSWEGAPTSNSETGSMQVAWVQVYSSMPDSTPPPPPQPADALTPGATTISATAGDLFSGPVATFTDNNTAVLAGGLAATIDWGDGDTSAGVVTGSDGSFSVSGSHTYSAAGSGTAAVTLNEDDPGTATATADSTVTIDAPTPLSAPASAAIVIPASQVDATENVSNATITATSGNHMVFIDGTGDTVALTGGVDTITGNGSGNTILLPAAGTGSVDVYGSVFSNGDTIDLKQLLAATSWNGQEYRLSRYLVMTTSGAGANAVLEARDTPTGEFCR